MSLWENISNMGQFPWSNLDNTNFDWFISEFFGLADFVKKNAEDDRRMKEWVVRNVKPINVIRQLVEATHILETDKEKIRENLGIRDPESGDVVKDVLVDGVSVKDADGIARLERFAVKVRDVLMNGQSLVDEEGNAIIPNIEVPVLDIVYDGQSVVSEKIATIPAPKVKDVVDENGVSVVSADGKATIPAVPVKQVVDENGISVVDPQGKAQLPRIPVKEVVDENGTSVVGSDGRAKLPKIPVKDVVNKKGISLVNTNGVAEIPDAPVQQVIYRGDNIIDNAGKVFLPNAGFIASEQLDTESGTANNVMVLEATNYLKPRGNVVMKQVTMEPFEALNDVECFEFGYANDLNQMYYPALTSSMFHAPTDPTAAFCILGSYLRKGIYYGNDKALFDTYLSEYERAESMVCSDFVQTAIFGIPYQASKYTSHQGEYYNRPGCFGSQFAGQVKSLLAPVEKDALITRELAALLASSGRLEPLQYNMGNVYPGDLLFNTGEPEDDVSTSNYLGILHVAVVVDVQRENKLLTVLECGHTTYRTMGFNFTDGQNTGDYAQPIYSEIEPFTDKVNDVRWYVGRIPWSNIPAFKKTDITLRHLYHPIRSATDMIADFDNLEIEPGDYVRVTISGNFEEGSPRDSSEWVRLLLYDVRAQQHGEQTYRIGRYYNYGNKCPNQIVVSGFCYGETDRIYLNASASRDFDLENYTVRCEVFSI